MRKAWRRIFLLCAALMICLQGLCLAYYVPEGNWARYWPEGEGYPYYLDVDSVKAREYNGRKYLEYVSVGADYKGSYTRRHMILDIENGNKKMLFLVSWKLVIQNDKLVSEHQIGSEDISDITTNKAFGDDWVFGPPLAAIQWTEQNRPDIINEIRTFNRSGQSAGKTDVTGAANATGDMTPPQYDITDSGVVKYTMRADTHDSVKAWLSPGGPDYYIVKMSDSLRATKSQWGYKRPGDYIIAYWKYPHQQYVKHTDDTWEFSEEYDPKEEQDKELMVYRTFSYNPSTDMFTFYSGDGGELDGLNIRVVDRNTIYVEDLSAKSLQPKNWKAEWTAVFKYVNYNSLTKPHKEYADSCSIILYMDDGIWFPDHKCEMAGSTCDQNLFSACVDMALAFKAVKGQIGELPEGYEFTEW